MALAVGSRLGHYDVTALIGEGGMGQVYRATDTTLKREVALKVLPADTAADPERLARFQREAQAIAALNHPNVVTIYSVERADGTHFLTMELVEGKTLSELIPLGGLPLEDFLAVALPLTDAVSAAHERRIVHRDLKPANVMVDDDGRLKVLDFGLAKLRSELSAPSDAETASTWFTAPHRVLGTAAYMSPEQAEGKPADARSDIFSLGVVLFEMATGTRPFRGDSPAATISSILRDTPPPLREIRPELPADLDRVIRRCLAKDPDRRYHVAAALRSELVDLQEQVTPTETRPSAVASARSWSPGRWRRVTAAVGAGAVVVAVALWLAVASRQISAPPLPTNFNQLTSDPGIEWFPSLAPDGQWIVFAGDAAGNRDIYLQSVTGQTAINLTADSADDEDQPSFSPDGERIAFRSDRDGGGIFVMGRTGEAVRRVTPEGFNPAWSPDGTRIVYASIPQGLRPANTEGYGELWVVSATGGDSTLVYGGGDAMLPHWSPHGHRIAFGQRLGAVRQANVVTIPADGGEPVAVTAESDVSWNPVWAPDGRRLYYVSNRGGSTNVWRVAIDEATGRVLGEPEPLTTPSAFAAHLTISADGRRLAYSSVQETQNIFRLGLDPATGDAQGDPVPVTRGTRFWSNPDPSPDGQSVVFYSQVQPEGDLYVIKTDGTGLRQVTSDAATDRVPRWSPDGEWIVSFSDRSGELQVWKSRVDGSELQQVRGDVGEGGVSAWSPDGARLAVATIAVDPGAPERENAGAPSRRQDATPALQHRAHRHQMTPGRGGREPRSADAPRLQEARGQRADG